MASTAPSAFNITSGFDLLSYFQEADDNDLVAVAEPRTLEPLDVLIREGEASPGLFIVTRGLFDVRVGLQQPTSVGKRGAGELLGEVSFLTGEGANATVVALEPCEVLALPAEVIQQKVEQDVVFAARFYQVLARVAARKLTEQTRRTMPFSLAITHSPELDSRLRSGVHQMKAEISALDADLAKGRTSGDERSRVRDILDRAMELVKSLFDSDSQLPAALHPDVALFLRQELLPLLLLSRVCERSYTKPRGYAGDFLVIDMLYSQEPAGVGRLGPLLDEYILGLPVAQAVRNRRGLLREAFLKLLANTSVEKLHITSLACGPAREVFDMFEKLNEPKRVTVNCLDLDFQALSAVSRAAEERGIQRSIQLVQENLILLATGRRTMSLPPQHLVYSIGLIDYFQDKLVILLLNWIYDTLGSGGQALLGNFDPRSPDRAFMDHILEWRLIYRTPDDMRNLFARSKFAGRQVDVQYEQQGINLFASCRK